MIVHVFPCKWAGARFPTDGRAAYAAGAMEAVIDVVRADEMVDLPFAVEDGAEDG